MSSSERNFLIVLALVVVAALGLIVWETRKSRGASNDTATASDATNDQNVINAGSGGPAYLSYNMPSFYNAGPPLNNYMTATPAPSTPTDATCGPCGSFRGLLN